MLVEMVEVGNHHLETELATLVAKVALVEETSRRLATLMASTAVAEAVLLVRLLVELDNLELDNLEVVVLMEIQELVVVEHKEVELDKQEDLEIVVLMETEHNLEIVEIMVVAHKEVQVETLEMEHKVEILATQETLEVQTMEMLEVQETPPLNRLQLVEVQDIQSKLVLEDLLPSLGMLHK